MKVYVAAPSGRHKLAGNVAAFLRNTCGATIVSTWHDDESCKSYMGASANRLRAESQRDVKQIYRADVLVAITDTKAESRGGNHSEFGMALMAGKEVVLIGSPSNIFHYHPRVVVIDDGSPESIEAGLVLAMRHFARRAPKGGGLKDEIRQIQDMASPAIESVMAQARSSGAHAAFSWQNEGHIHLHRAVRHLLIALLARHPKSADLAHALAHITQSASAIGCPDASTSKPCNPSEDHVAAGLCRAAMDIATRQKVEK